MNMREAILDVAQDLMQRRGINGMSFGDIAKAVDIRKASVHHHFPSKDDLIHAVVSRYRTEFQAALSGITQSSVRAKTKLQRFMQLFEDTIAYGNNEKTCLCGMLSAEVLSLSEENIELVRGFLDDCRDAIVEILKEGQEDGSFNLRGSVKSVSDLFLATLEGGLLIARVDGGSDRFSKLVRQLEKSIS